MTAIAQPAVSRSVFIWLALATIAGATGVLARLPFPGPQLIIVGVTAAALIVSLTVFRTWLDSVPLRWLVGINAARLVGVAFLVLAARGQLNPVFAARAGWGDIAVAIVAIPLVLFTAPRSVLLIWNAAGLLDLVTAVATATFVSIKGLTPGLEPVLTLPLSLIPTFGVPLYIAVHVAIFRRLLRG